MVHHTIAAVKKKIVVVGDGGCGKTCLLSSYVKKEMPDEYVPTIFEAYTANTQYEGKTFELDLNDTAGQDAYDRLRPLQYPDTDVMLICFAADSPDSFYNAHDKWIPEARHFCPEAALVMVCTKIDLREDKETISRLEKTKQKPISFDEGQKFSEQIKALAYIECSALDKTNIDNVFQTAIRATILKQKQNKKLKKMKQLRCKIL